MVTFEWEPSVLYSRDAAGEMIEPFGIDIEVVKALAGVFNFTPVYAEPPPCESAAPIALSSTHHTHGVSQTTAFLRPLKHCHHHYHFGPPSYLRNTSTDSANNYHHMHSLADFLPCS